MARTAESRLASIAVRLTHEQAVRLQLAALRDGLSVSEKVRQWAGSLPPPMDGEPASPARRRPTNPTAYHR